MAVIYRQAGKLIEYTATGNVAYHAPVAIGSLIGIARKSAVSGEKISCDAEGVFQFTKGSGALTAGTPVTITVATATAAATAAGATSNGVVWADAASDATVVDVKINQFIPVASE